MTGIKENKLKINKYKNIDLFTIYNAVTSDFRVIKKLSGGDRIIIELAKKWKNIFRSHTVITCSSGSNIIKTYLKNSKHLKIRLLKKQKSIQVAFQPQKFEQQQWLPPPKLCPNQAEAL